MRGAAVKSMMLFVDFSIGSGRKSIRSEAVGKGSAAAEATRMKAHTRNGKFEMVETFIHDEYLACVPNEIRPSNCRDDNLFVSSPARYIQLANDIIMRKWAWHNIVMCRRIIILPLRSMIISTRSR